MVYVLDLGYVVVEDGKDLEAGLGIKVLQLADTIEAKDVLIIIITIIIILK